jgi:hypothetical protein
MTALVRFSNASECVKAKDGVFGQCNDLVLTEETIWGGLEMEDLDICSDYVFVKFPFADVINKSGVNAAQEIVNAAQNQHASHKVIFICQHINVDKICFSSNAVVFTPHATTNDDFYAIPHFTHFDTHSPIRPIDRCYDFSFHGASYTHHTRRALLGSIPNNNSCSMKDTGVWHFDKSPEDLQKCQQTYLEVLKNTKISLCPRGTGPSTIRIWDSLAVGSIPLIISDGLKMPLSNVVDWGKACFFAKESEASCINIDSYPQEVLQEKSDYGFKIFQEYFNIDNLHKSVLINLMNT